jgi:hypothetical protein
MEQSPSEDHNTTLRSDRSQNEDLRIASSTRSNTNSSTSSCVKCDTTLTTPKIEPPMSSAIFPPLILPPFQKDPINNVISFVADRSDLYVTAPETPPAGFDDHYLGALTEVRASDIGGLGLFVTQDIPAGSIILYEAPLFIIPHSINLALTPHMERRSKRLSKGYDFTEEAPDPLDTVIKGLDNHRKNAFYGLCSHKRDERESIERAIVWSNGFQVLDGKATGIFDVLSRINHSCVPNSSFVWCDPRHDEMPFASSTQLVETHDPISQDEKEEVAEVGRMMVFNSFSLMSGEEITIDYGHSVAWLRKWYGFDCACGCCTDGSDSSSDESVLDDSYDSFSSDKD